MVGPGSGGSGLCEEPPLNAPEAPGYLVQNLLGEGGFGIVYAGVQLASNQRVALKFFKRGFSHELEGLVRLGEHPYIAGVLDANDSHDPPYLVTQLLHESLGAYMERKAAPIEVDKAARWLEQMARALYFIHQRNVAHCDLKPDNVLLDDEEQARLIDFGQSTARGQRANLGTAFFMPPEQVVSVLLKHSKPTPGWDVYALGATFYRALTGRLPRECDLESLGDKVNAAWLTGYRTRLMRQPLIPMRKLNPKIDTRLALIVERCLEIEPWRRYESAAEILEDLEFRASHRPHFFDEIYYRFGKKRRPGLDLGRHPAVRGLCERILGDGSGLAFVVESGVLLAPGRFETPGSVSLGDVLAVLRDLPDLTISKDRQTLSGTLRCLGVTIRITSFRNTAFLDCLGGTVRRVAREVPDVKTLLREGGALLLGAGMRPALVAGGSISFVGQVLLAEQLALLKPLDGVESYHYQDHVAIYLG